MDSQKGIKNNSDLNDSVIMSLVKSILFNALSITSRFIPAFVGDVTGASAGFW
jgi:hypothetical protein